MNNIVDINYFKLFMGYALLAIPIFILWYYKTGLIKDTIIAAIRMTLQLLLVGVYLEYIFSLNNAYINILWVFLMMLVTTFSIINRTKLRLKIFFLPMLLATFISLLVTDAYFLGYLMHVILFP